ncbi:hypothetical protein CJ030_MR1G022972 [Morella rubra]|uniref:At2g35280-like TPR domain-containing protein n=1 Tax=Morella rubra TaxID=262757 RepID=A0A6A1WRQ1_9ROSI|nr:hypothetical protein CJ030_MR1G022972 [Morella rubra]
MTDYLTTLPKGLLQYIIIKATRRSPWRDPYFLDCPEIIVNTLLSVCGTCKVFSEASDCGDVYRACRVEELPDHVACPLKEAKFVHLLFVHCNLNVLFLRGICTMFVRNNYFGGLKLVDEAMEAENPKASYLFCMLELLRGSDLKFEDMERVFKCLGPLKENENMLWLRDRTIQQFFHEWNDEYELIVRADGWLRFNDRCQITKVPGLNSKYAVDYYDDYLCMYSKANREMTFFVYRLTGQYLLPF